MSKVDLLEIKGVQLCSAKVVIDPRGTFTKFYEQGVRPQGGFDPYITSLMTASNNDSGTIRGLHFQVPPFEEEKVIICLHGKILDVIVDLRSDSPTRGDWASIQLSSDEPQSLCLPMGIAHGYQTLTPETTVFYALTSEFNQENAYSLHYADTDLNIPWPLPARQVSAKDATGISLSRALLLLKGHDGSGS